MKATWNWDVIGNFITDMGMEHNITFWWESQWDIDRVTMDENIWGAHTYWVDDQEHDILILSDLRDLGLLSLANHVVLHEIAHAVHLEAVGYTSYRKVYETWPERAESDADWFADTFCRQVKVFNEL